MNNRPVWEDEGWHALPVLQGNVRADFCVVGLGGSGLSAVRELRAHGYSVAGIDAGIVAGGAAGRNGGFLLAGLAEFHHDAVVRWGRDVAASIYRMTLDELDRITAETPDAVRRNGSLRIAADEEELRDCERQLVAMHDDHLPVEWYGGPEGEGLFFPRDGAFNPLLRCRLLASRAIADGAMLFEQSKATTITSDRVTTPNGVVHCGRVIVAVDGGLETLIPELEGRVRTARLQMLATEPVDHIVLPRPVYFRWGYEYWQQLPDGRIAIGGFRDWAGESEWTSSVSISPAVQEQLEAFLRGRLGVTEPISHRWAGLVGFSENGLPVVEEVRAGLWALGGYDGTGNVLGALAGRGVAQLAIGRDSPFLAALRHAAAGA
jgi:gamma-glutamylputrescine oxidase